MTACPRPKAAGPATALGVALALLSAPAALAQTGSAPTFPDVASARADKAARTVKLRSGATVQIAPYRLTPRAGASENAAAVWCGVVLSQRRASPSTLVTVGRGPLEAVSCDGLREAGEIASADGQPRLGLIYDVRSPNATSRAAAILAREADGGWIIDSAATERAAELAEPLSLKALRALGPTRAPTQ